MCLIQNTTVDKQLLTYHFKVAQNWAPETWSLCLPRGLLCTASEIAKHEGMLYAHVAPAFQLSSYSRVLKRTGSRAGIPGFGPWLDHYVTLRKRTLPAKCTNFLLGNMQIILVSSSHGSCRNQLAHIKDTEWNSINTSYLEPPRPNTRGDEDWDHPIWGMVWDGRVWHILGA